VLSLGASSGLSVLIWQYLIGIELQRLVPSPWPMAAKKAESLTPA